MQLPWLKKWLHDICMFGTHHKGYSTFLTVTSARLLYEGLSRKPQNKYSKTFILAKRSTSLCNEIERSLSNFHT